MPRVRVRELKNQTSEILRAVREERAEYIITYQGRPMAVPILGGAAVLAAIR